MFNRKPKVVSGWSVTTNPNKFDGDVILGLGSFNELSKKGGRRNCGFEDYVTIRLNKDEACKLCEAIMKPFTE